MIRARPLVAAAAAVLLIVGGFAIDRAMNGGGERSKSLHSVEAQRELADRWSSPGADEVSHDPSDSSPRMQVADELMRLDSILSGASAATVRRILGRPGRSSAHRWEYIASRRRPSDGYGGWCIRRFTITFDKHDRVMSMDRGGEECPRGLND